MLRPLTNRQVEQLHDDRSEDQPHQKTFDLVPNPGAQRLRGKLELPFDTEPVVIEACSERFADRKEQ